MTARTSRGLAAALVAGTMLWPVALASTVHVEAPRWRAAIFLAAGRVCHQQPDRSFHTAGRQWPVCGRCLGLYAAAPLGALLACGLYRARPVRSTRIALALAFVPTAVTIGLEWSGVADVSNGARFLSALPLGAVAAFVVVELVQGTGRSIGYTHRP